MTITTIVLAAILLVVLITAVYVHFKQKLSYESHSDMLNDRISALNDELKGKNLQLQHAGIHLTKVEKNLQAGISDYSQLNLQHEEALHTIHAQREKITLLTNIARPIAEMQGTNFGMMDKTITEVMDRVRKTFAGSDELIAEAVLAYGNARGEIPNRETPIYRLTRQRDPAAKMRAARSTRGKAIAEAQVSSGE